MILPFLSSLACLLPLHPVFQSVFLLFVLSLVSPICYGFSSLNFNLFFFFFAWCLFGIPVPGGLSPIEPSGCCPHIPKTQAECPAESSASSTTASLLFFLRESNTGSLLISFPTGTDSEARDHVLVTVEFSRWVLCLKTEWVCNMFFYTANEVLNVNSSWLYQHSLHI